MPHDVMPTETASLEPEFDDLPAPPDTGSSILAQMKRAGQALVTRARRNTSKGIVLAAVAAAGAALCLPAHAQIAGESCSVGPISNATTFCVPDPSPPAKTLGGGGGMILLPLGLLFGPRPIATGSGTGGNTASGNAASSNAATGNVFYAATDYTTAGPNPLRFTRYYNSMADGVGYGTVAATLDINWRSNYDRYLQIGYDDNSNPTQVIAERGDGQQITFNASGGGFVTDSDADYTLTYDGTNFTLTMPDDSVEVYPASYPYNCAQVSTITARDGYQQTLTYGSNDTSGHGSYRILANPQVTNYYGVCYPQFLQSVTDSYGRTLSFTYDANDRLSTVSTPDSLVLTYGFDATNGQLTSVSYNTSPTTTTTYEYNDSVSAVALTDIIDENGNDVASWTYDPNTLQAVSSQQGGSLAANATTFTYNSDGTTTATNANGVADTYSFTTLQGAPKVTSISRAATSSTAAATESFGYDSNGYLNTKTDWNGNTTNYTNDSHGQPTQIVEAYGSGVQRTTNITYDSTWVHLPSTITTPGLTRSFTYDSSGNPLTMTDTDTTTNSVPYSTNGQTREWQWTWNGTGEMTSVQLPRTDATVKYTLTWGSDGALNSITDPLSHTTSITSNTGGGYPTTIVDPNSMTTTLGWDTRLNLNTVTVSTGAGDRTTTYTHDAANELTSIQWPDSSKLSFAYDAAHRLTTITDLPGNSVNLTLDALGDVTALAVKNSGGTTKLSHTATFDALGRKLTDVGASGQTTSFTWDPNGNLLSAEDSLSNTVTFTFDALNRLATRTESNPLMHDLFLGIDDPAPGGTTTFTLNAHNRLTNVQDANGNSTSYTRDGFGDVTQVASPDSGTSVYTWDKDRNLTQKVFNGGQTVNLTYDAADRNLTIAYPSDSSLNVSKTYDQSGHGFGVGRLTSVTDQAGSDSFTYDERGNTTNESRVITSVGTLTTATAFDANSNISSITYPSGTVVTYTRDSMGLVTGITAQPPGAGSPSTVASSITHAPYGPVTGLTFGNGITGTYSFDNDYRATGRVDTATSDVMNLAYTYFANNSLKTITDGVNAADSQTLSYGGETDRLTSAVSGTGGYGTYSWTWDKVGNVATQTINGTATTFNLNSGSNQLASTVTGSTTTTVDTTANGNIEDFKVGATTVTSYTYNLANQMASATGSLGSSATYEYGFEGQRLLKTPSSGYPIAYQYGQAAKELLSENDLHSGQTADYIYMDPGRNNRPVSEVNPTTGAIYFMDTGRLGTVEAATDNSKAVVWSAQYNPFGDTGNFSGTLTTQSLRLPGQYFDPETNNNHNGFRDYAGTLTRYVQSDPLGLGGGMNTYQYVRDNPFTYTDPLGLDSSNNCPAASQGGDCNEPGSSPKQGGGSTLNCPSGSVLCTGQGDSTEYFFNGPSDPDPIGGLSDIPFVWEGGGGGGLGLPMPHGGGGAGNGPYCKPNDPICGNSPGDPILGAIRDDGLAGAAAGWEDGFTGGEFFGGAETVGLAGPITGTVGAVAFGAAGGVYGALQGTRTALSCYIGNKYQKAACKP